MGNYSYRSGRRAGTKNRYRRKRRCRINYAPIIKTGVVVFALLLIIMLFKSCGHKVGDIRLEAGWSAVYLEDDGSVKYGAAENFEGELFDEEELEEQVEKEVKTFNANDASKSDAMDLKYFDVSSDVAKVIFTFETENDFSKYMNLYNRQNDFTLKDEDGNKPYEFYIGKVKDFEGKIDTSFVSPDKSKKIDAKDLKDNEKMILVPGNYKVQIEGTITFISENCTVEDDIVTVKGNKPGYIIYSLDD